MANVAQKFLTLVNGVFTQVTSTIVGGAGAENKILQTDQNGYIDPTVLPPGLGPEVVTAVASEALAAGDFVNFYNAAGVLNMRKADASSSAKGAHGFVLASVLSGASATAYTLGKNGQVSGLTVGDAWLSDVTPGGVAAAPPTASGHIVQRLGFVLSATNLDVDIKPPVTLA